MTFKKLSPFSWIVMATVCLLRSTVSIISVIYLRSAVLVDNTYMDIRQQHQVQADLPEKLKYKG